MTDEPELLPAESEDEIEERAPAMVRAAPAKQPPNIRLGSDERGLVPQDIGELWRFSQIVVASALAPKGIKTPEQAFIAIQMGMEAGLKPMKALLAIDVIEGRPCWRGEAALGLIRSSADCAEGPVTGVQGEGDDRMGVCRSKPRGMKDWVQTTFSVGEAKTAKLWGKLTRENKPTPWVLYPEDMLIWRAVARHAKRYYSQVLLGFPMAEEAMDYGDAQPIREINPPKGKDPLLTKLAGGESEDGGGPAEDAEQAPLVGED